MDISEAIAIVFGLSGAVLGFLGWRKAGEANRLSSESNTIARSSKATADDANKLATDANWLSGDANRLAIEANEIAREANSVVATDIEYRRQREWESQRAVLHIPDRNSLAFLEGKGPNAVLGVHLQNKGAGEIRDLVMTVFDNETKVAVEQGTIRRLTRDDGVNPTRLRFLIYYTTEWRDSLQDHLIRVHFSFEDGTGHREEDYCFRFSEAGNPNWLSTKVPCDSASPQSLEH